MRDEEGVRELIPDALMQRLYAIYSFLLIEKKKHGMYCYKSLDGCKTRRSNATIYVISWERPEYKSLTWFKMEELFESFDCSEDREAVEMQHTPTFGKVDIGDFGRVFRQLSNMRVLEELPYIQLHHHGRTSPEIQSIIPYKRKESSSPSRQKSESSPSSQKSTPSGMKFKTEISADCEIEKDLPTGLKESSPSRQKSESSPSRF
ncbi:hypothetical protein LXL04_023693 [Taraxacum kok-saghyz]